ncbi:hypothetical protein BDZ91DRAFT_793718 [Kalaharituber pfeilii]|nr:hypothetical protein BDZ91DRAFT_793718 [Kalaharituber pfeilii]
MQVGLLWPCEKSTGSGMDIATDRPLARPITLPPPSSLMLVTSMNELSSNLADLGALRAYAADKVLMKGKLQNGFRLTNSYPKSSLNGIIGNSVLIPERMPSYRATCLSS